MKDSRDCGVSERLVEAGHRSKRADIEEVDEGPCRIAR
jgi:hypothetical protein